ncbi:MAG: hydroxymethylbilane synthase [Candidatus Omnitrophota bacterium]|jgi:hydroxymethylbilane synthase
MKALLRLGTRGSPLALYQAEFVKARILRDFPMTGVEIVTIKTAGDRIRREKSKPLETKSIFTREIEEALLAGGIDLAVHSAKDLAVRMSEGLRIGAVLEREDPRDCLLSSGHRKLSELPPEARVGTSSLRRKTQLLRLRPGFVVSELHGNVQTRLPKLDEGQFDAVILALAGIRRLGLESHVSEIFAEEIFYPAPGQGIIAVQSRAADAETNEVLRSVHDRQTGIRFDCERAFLETLEGGCRLPCGISTVLSGNILKASGIILAVDDPSYAEAHATGTPEAPAALGVELARQVLRDGGQAILEKIREHYGQG